MKQNGALQIDKSQVQVITRAVSILRALEDQADGLSLGAISQRVGLARSTVQRIVAALSAEKMLIAASPTGRVRLGPTILRLAASMATDFTAIVHPFLVKLADELRETVDLGAIRRDHLVFVDQVIGPQRLRLVSEVGEAFPLHCTANGKAYLAQLDDKSIERLIGKSYDKCTPSSAGSIAELLKDLAIVRKTRVAFDCEEHTPGICAVGVAFHDPLGNPLAISVPMPTPRFHERKYVIAERLLATLCELQKQGVATA